MLAEHQPINKATQAGVRAVFLIPANSTSQSARSKPAKWQGMGAGQRKPGHTCARRPRLYVTVIYCSMQGRSNSTTRLSYGKMPN